MTERTDTNPRSPDPTPPQAKGEPHVDNVQALSALLELTAVNWRTPKCKRTRTQRVGAHTLHWFLTANGKTINKFDNISFRSSTFKVFW